MGNPDNKKSANPKTHRSETNTPTDKALSFSDTVEVNALSDSTVPHHLHPEEDEPSLPPTPATTTPKVSDASQEAYPTDVIDKQSDADSPHINIGAARLTKQLVVTEQASGTRFTFPSEQIDEITIGRRSTTMPSVLQIDLSDLIEPRDGVSRRHASIVRQDGLLFIVDRDSRNGTYLNGQELIPEQLRIIRDSDLIRMGRIVLSISFESFPKEHTPT